VKAHKKIDLAPALDVIASIAPVKAGDLIPLLQKLQDAYGYLPRPVLEAVADETGIPLSRVAGVTTFYEQFSLTPRGRHIIHVCRGTACHVRGAARIASETARVLGVGEGKTTEDMMFTFNTVACLGACALAPLMVVDRDYYAKMTPEKVGAVLESYAQRK